MSLLSWERPVNSLLSFIYLLDKYLLNLSLVDETHCWAPWTVARQNSCSSAMVSSTFHLTTLGHHNCEPFCQLSLQVVTQYLCSLKMSPFPHYPPPFINKTGNYSARRARALAICSPHPHLKPVWHRSRIRVTPGQLSCCQPSHFAYHKCCGFSLPNSPEAASSLGLCGEVSDLGHHFLLGSTRQPPRCQISSSSLHPSFTFEPEWSFRNIAAEVSPSLKVRVGLDMSTSRHGNGCCQLQTSHSGATQPS